MEREAAVAEPAQHVHRVRGGVAGDRQILGAVGVEVADDQVLGLADADDVGGVAERAVAVAEPHDDAVAAEVGRGEVLAAIGVEVAGVAPSRLAITMGAAIARVVRRAGRRRLIRFMGRSWERGTGAGRGRPAPEERQLPVALKKT